MVCEDQLWGSQVVLVAQKSGIGVGILNHTHHITMRVDASNVVLSVDAVPKQYSCQQII